MSSHIKNNHIRTDNNKQQIQQQQQSSGSIWESSAAAAKADAVTSEVHVRPWHPHALRAGLWDSN